MTLSVHRPDPTAATATSVPGASQAKRLIGLSISALGVVYGDIGTSPLYALDLMFFGRSRDALARADVIGGISLAIWALTLVIACKYAVFVLRADNDGEGGVFALYAMLDKFKVRGQAMLSWALLLGAGLLFGDGIITPAISVLSAVEGVIVVEPVLGPAVVPLTLLILTLLFAFQYRGTGGMGRIFGPVMIVWFTVIALLGVTQVVRHPEILEAFNPRHALQFLVRGGGLNALFTLGAVMLVLTGGEAMFADMGHFGARPIRVGWFGMVYPCLLLNYLGQGAFLLGLNGPIHGGLFYSMVPPHWLVPAIVLATCATVIASQALISGVFSLVSQAIALGLFPRLRVRHTHHDQAGEVYLASINWALWLGCLALVLGFRSSNALGGAYGFAVSGDMLITSVAMFFVARRYWHWSLPAALGLFGLFGSIDASFLLANSVKFLEGGYIPLSIGVLIFCVMVTWRWGRKITYGAYASKPTMTMAQLIELHRSDAPCIDRTAILMVPAPARVHVNSERTPALLQLLWDRFGLLPRHLIFVQVVHPKVPYVHEGRYQVSVFERGEGRSIIRVEMKFGFMEEPNVEAALRDMALHHEIDLSPDMTQWIVHVVNENLVPSPAMPWPRRLRLRVFKMLRFVSRPTYYHYGLGDEVQLAAEILPIRVR